MAVEIDSWTDLAAIPTSGLDGDYLLIANLSGGDADYTSAGGNNWTPIGDNSTPFTGTFDGNGKTISDLILTANSVSYRGLFGKISGATVENLGVIDYTINVTTTSTYSYRIGFIGSVFASSIVTNCYATGVINQTSGSNHFIYIGGLIGEVDGSAISKCWSDVDITVTQGGIVGQLGGLIGDIRNNNASVIDCYSLGNIDLGSDCSANYYTGGCIGLAYNTGTTVKNCYSTGNVDATGAVSGNSFGGFIGLNHASNVTTNCFAVGVVTCPSQDEETWYVGGFCGQNQGELVNCWWFNGTNTLGIGYDTTEQSVSKATDASDFYVSTQNVYDTETPNWSAPPWYWHTSAYPDFIAPIITGILPLFKPIIA